MFSCGTPKTKIKEISLANKNFSELIFNIKNSKLKFDNYEGVFKQISNEDPNYKSKSNDKEYEKLKEEEAQILKEITDKSEKVRIYKEKIKEINSKIEFMQKILTIDLNERDYIVNAKESLNVNNK